MPNQSQDHETTAIDRVKRVYVALAARPVERSCIRRRDCCHFKLTGRTPFLTKGEAIVAARALRRTGRTKLPELVNGACPLLHPATGDCMIYDDRPFGCRTHFCAAAGGPYQRREVIDLIRQLEHVDAQLGGDGPHEITQAIKVTLEELE